MCSFSDSQESAAPIAHSDAVGVVSGEGGGAGSADRHLEVVLVNPLGAALKHYTTSLERLLIDCGAVVTSVVLMEPSAPGQSRRRWIGEYVKTLWDETRKKSDKRSQVVVIQTWPMLGYWDFVISKLILGHTPALIVLHDPHPLVRAVGYGRVARWAASQPLVAAAAIVHSKTAADAVREQATLSCMTQLPLPMLPPRRPESRGSGEPVIRVLGQYKADRDIESMARIAAEGPQGWRYEVVGRRWPPVSGWQVSDRFVAEEEFETLIRDSDAILIPYTRFYQSDVAVRSLEMGTPVVGPRSSSLVDVMGSESDWLVDGESWIQAVEAAIRANPEVIYRVARRTYNNVLEQWRAWLDQTSQ